jgi:ribonuclease R
MGSKERPFPPREKILEFIRDSPKRVGRRDIARAFHLGAAHRQSFSFDTF